MSEIFRFRNLPVYNDARKFNKELKKFINDKYPKEEKYCLTQQTSRALDSIVLNIAEGSEKYSDIDFSRFLNTSLGSLNEVVACLDVAFDNNYINEEELQYFLEKAENIYKQLKAFSSKVRKDKYKF